MANTKEIQKRMKSIKDTMKITNAMYMISSTKLQKAKKKLADTEPYFYTLQQAFQRILRHTPDLESIYFKDTGKIPAEDKKVGYIVVTADKGLAGAYNHNIFKMAHSLFEQGGKNSLFVLGELGRQYFAREGLRVHKHFKYTVQDPSLHRARMITDDIIERYRKGELDEVYILYTRMENAVTAVAEKRKLLPLEKDKFADADAAAVLGKDLKSSGSQLCKWLHLRRSGGILCERAQRTYDGNAVGNRQCQTDSGAAFHRIQPCASGGDHAGDHRGYQWCKGTETQKVKCRNEDEYEEGKNSSDIRSCH